jgi:hypothetical protein
MLRRTIICAAIIIGAASHVALAGEAGTSGFMFLRFGNGARPSGLAEAFTAVSDDASSIYYNPAGMANIEGLELDLTHSEWLVDIRFEQVTLVNEMLGGAVGLNFTGVYYGELDRYGEAPTLTPDGTFSPYDLALSGGYATDVLPNLSVGGTFKLIYSKIDFESASSWAIDLGVLHRSKIKGLTLGASLLNLGPQAKFVEEKFYPPLELRAGAAYKVTDERLKGSLLLSADAVFPNDSDVKILGGAEYILKDILSVRLGYKGNYYSQGATIGFGVYYKGLKFDYAYMPIEYDLGNVHRVSLGFISPAR